LLKQPHKLMAKLNLRVDDHNPCHITLTLYTLDRSKTAINHQLRLIFLKWHFD